MDVLAWIGGVTSLANMIKAWLEARKAGLDVDEARARVVDAVNAGEYEVGGTEEELASGLVIDESLLEAFIEDIGKAQERFSAAINDIRYTPAQLDQEQERARVSICTHLQKIREFNDDALPTGSLDTHFYW